MLFSKPKPLPFHYAGFNRRMWAATVDTLLLLLITPLLDLLSPGSDITLDLAAVQEKMAMQTDGRHALGVFWQAMVDAGVVHHWLVNTAIQTAVLCALTAFFWHRWGATPGKMLLRMKVVDAATEAPITGKQIALRLIGYCISSAVFLFGFLWIGFDKKKQGWHDKIAGTVVVIIPRKQSKNSLSP